MCGGGCMRWYVLLLSRTHGIFINEFTFIITKILINDDMVKLILCYSQVGLAKAVRGICCPRLKSRDN